MGARLPHRVGDAPTRGADAARQADDRAAVQGVPPTASRGSPQRGPGASGRYLVVAAAAQNSERAHQVSRKDVQRVAHRRRSPREPRRALPARGAVLRRPRRALQASRRARRFGGFMAAAVQQRRDPRRLGARAARALARGERRLLPWDATRVRRAGERRDQNRALPLGDQLAQQR